MRQRALCQGKSLTLNELSGMCLPLTLTAIKGLMLKNSFFAPFTFVAASSLILSISSSALAGEWVLDGYQVSGTTTGLDQRWTYISNASPDNEFQKYDAAVRSGKPYEVHQFLKPENFGGMVPGITDSAWQHGSWWSTIDPTEITHYQGLHLPALKSKTQVTVSAVMKWKRRQITDNGITSDDPNDNPPPVIYVREKTSLTALKSLSIGGYENQEWNPDYLKIQAHVSAGPLSLTLKDSDYAYHVEYGQYKREANIQDAGIRKVGVVNDTAIVPNVSYDGRVDIKDYDVDGEHDGSGYTNWSYNAAPLRVTAYISSSLEKSYHKVNNVQSLPTKKDETTGVISVDESKIRETTPYLVNGQPVGPWAVENERLQDGSIMVDSAAQWYNPAKTSGSSSPSGTISNEPKGWFGRGQYHENVIDVIPDKYFWDITGGSSQGLKTGMRLPPADSTVFVVDLQEVPDGPGHTKVEGLRLEGKQNGKQITPSSTVSLKVEGVAPETQLPNGKVVLEDKYTVKWHPPYPSESWRQTGVNPQGWEVRQATDTGKQDGKNTTLPQQNMKFSSPADGFDYPTGTGKGNLASYASAAADLTAAGTTIVFLAEGVDPPAWPLAALSLISAIGGADAELNESDKTEPDMPVYDITFNYSDYKSDLLRQIADGDYVDDWLYGNNQETIVTSGFDGSLTDLDMLKQNFKSNPEDDEFFMNNVDPSQTTPVHDLRGSARVLFKRTTITYTGDAYDDHGYVGEVDARRRQYSSPYIRRVWHFHMASPSSGSTGGA